MDLIPLDPSLVRGTHGVRPKDPLDWPVLFGSQIQAIESPLPATGVYHQLLKVLGKF